MESGMTVQVSRFVKGIIFAERAQRRTRHDIGLLSSRLYSQKTAFAVLLVFRYLSAVRFV